MKSENNTNSTAGSDCQERFVLPLFIVNVYDRPSEKFIAEKRADGTFYYVHPALRNDREYWRMTPENPTPLERFGIETEIRDGQLHGRKIGRSEATYADGRRRLWQGEPEFSFSWQNNIYSYDRAECDQEAEA
jgi:hypothetical protein